MRPRRQDPRGDRDARGPHDERDERDEREPGDPRDVRDPRGDHEPTSNRMLLTGFIMLSCAVLAVIALLTYGLTTEHNLGTRVSLNQTADTQALCSLRGDVERRVASGTAFLQVHPRGIPGISALTIRSGIDNSRRTVKALGSLVCPKQP
jgi:hypothetical protein